MARTPKTRALGNALRRAREDHGLTVRQLAARLDRDAGILSRWESGTRTPKPEQVAQLLTTLDVRGERYEEVVALAQTPEEPNWVATTLPAQRQQFAALLDFEQRATKITSISPLLVPGLLQTEEYIRSMMMTAGIPSAELAERIVGCNQRHEVLTRVGSTKLLALVGQAALHHVIGTVSLMIRQFRHLLELTRYPHIEIRVVPFHAGWHPALEGAFELIEPDDERPVVAVENRRSGLFLHESDDVRAYRRAVEDVERVALTTDESTRMIAGLISRMEQS